MRCTIYQSDVSPAVGTQRMVVVVRDKGERRELNTNEPLPDLVDLVRGRAMHPTHGD